MTLEQIIERAGGAKAVAEATQGTRRPVSHWAVYKWTSAGVPAHHLALLARLARVSVGRIVEANDSLFLGVAAGHEHRSAA